MGDQNSKEKIFQIHRLGFFARVLDILMVPLMYVVSGTFLEKPQQTHRWNVQNINNEEIKHLQADGMIRCAGVDAILRRHWWDLRFHIPIFGGWRNYVVLYPKEYWGSWHVGWLLRPRHGVSQVSVVGPVRMLLGSEEISFFGITDDGFQIPLELIGKGKIAGGGPYTNIPLL